MKSWSLLLFSLVISFDVHGAACCGGGFATPATITGDDKAQFTSTISYSEVKADVRTDGLWRKRNENETSQTLRLEGAHIISDRWQLGAGIPIINRERLSKESTGLGDVSVSGAYEYLPEFEYSPWKPKGIGFLQLTAPTGKSIYETGDVYGLDSRGRGFWALGVGTILTKVFGRFDSFFSTEIHRSFEKKVSNSQVDGTLLPGWGNNTTIGGGYNLASYRLGAALSWSYEDPIDVQGVVSSDGQAQRYGTATLMASYLANDEWAATISYADQTLIGSPTNTSLSKIVMLQAQRRWGR